MGKFEERTEQKGDDMTNFVRNHYCIAICVRIYKDIYHSRCITCQTRRLCGDVAKCTAGWEGGVPAVSYCIC